MKISSQAFTKAKHATCKTCKKSFYATLADCPFCPAPAAMPAPPASPSTKPFGEGFESGDLDELEETGEHVKADEAR